MYVVIMQAGQQGAAVSVDCMLSGKTAQGSTDFDDATFAAADVQTAGSVKLHLAYQEH